MVRKRRVNENIGRDRRETLLPAPSSGVFGFAEKNFTYVVIGAVVLVVLLAGSLIWRYVDKRQEAEAGEKLSQAVALYEQVLKEDGSLDQPLEQFQSIISNYGDTKSGVMSLYYAGNCLYALQRFEEAIALYDRFAKSAFKSTHLIILAYDSIGRCLEEQGEYEKAATYFQRTVEPAPGLGEIGLLNLARCYEALGDTENSLTYYQRVLMEYPQSRRLAYVQEKVKVLQDRSAEGRKDAVPEVIEEAGEETLEE